MKSKEVVPHPTGNFPSAAEELRERLGFFDKTNPVLKKIRVRLRELEMKGKRNLPFNLLSLYYGVHFYNNLCHHQIYSPDDRPPVNIIRNPNSGYSVYADRGSIFINLDSLQSAKEFSLPPMQTTKIYEGLLIYAPSYLCQILTGLEEANHLHLELLYEQHGSNYCHLSDHSSPERLWLQSGNDPTSYRAKLWNEFTVLPVQRAYLNFYFMYESPDTVTEFNHFYNQVKTLRHHWVRRKQKKKNH